jgi:hypothetical protein
MFNSSGFTAPLVTRVLAPTSSLADTLPQIVTSLWSPMGVGYSANHATTTPKTEMFFTVINRVLATKPVLLTLTTSNNLGKFELTNIP